MTKCQEYQTYAIFLNSCWFKEVKNDIPKCPKLTSDFCIVPQGLLTLETLQKICQSDLTRQKKKKRFPYSALLQCFFTGPPNPGFQALIFRTSD